MSNLSNPTQARFLGRYLTQARGEHQPRRLAPHQLNPLRGGRQGAAGTVARLIQGRRRPGALAAGVAQGRGLLAAMRAEEAGRAEDARGLPGWLRAWSKAGGGLVHSLPGWVLAGGSSEKKYGCPKKKYSNPEKKEKKEQRRKRRKKEQRKKRRKRRKKEQRKKEKKEKKNL
ncbi:hypothetical protein ACLB2K_008206 [Fragaria x ananassa]